MYRFLKLKFITFILITLGMLISSHLCKSEITSELHNLMDNSELEYYFNINKKLNNNYEIPKYGIVNFKKNVKRMKRNKKFENFFNDEQIHEINFDIFDSSLNLKLIPNNKLISPNMQVWRTNDINDNRELLNYTFNDNCHFIHNNDGVLAGLSNCQDSNKYHGIILTPNHTLEVQPITTRLQKVLTDKYVKDNFDSGHLIKVVKQPDILGKVFNLNRSIRSTLENLTDVSKIAPEENISARVLKKNAKYTVELGVFFDEAAYKLFAPHFSRQDRRLLDLLLAYMNGVQVLYQHPSLGEPIDVIIVYMQIMRLQPASFPTYGGERNQLLDSFCDYQQRLNPPTDNDQNHWDIALYISGLDFYGVDNGHRSGSTMGLATVKGACTRKYNCVIAEFGVTNSFGRPYPSAGFNSIYVAAHEIGHNLGMSHDALGNHCSREGYIMSASRGTQGETSWSTCSADVVRTLGNWASCLKDKPIKTPENYDGWKFQGYPGMKYSAKIQCEILLIDKDAEVSPAYPLGEICQNLQCRTPHKTGYFYAGPALEGTDCGPNKWCEGGYCVPKKGLPSSVPVTKGGWGPWKKEKCVSGCTDKSRGFQVRRRECNSPRPINTNEGCEGTAYDVDLCADTRICQTVRRRSLVQFASKKCRQFSEKLKDLDSTGVGLQAPYESNRLWSSCAIFCRRTGGSFYTPRMELVDLGLDAYFPDGTWCHNDEKQDYFCLQHHCLPEGFQFNKYNFWALSEDLPISGNANLKTETFSKNLLDYLSLDAHGKPIRTRISHQDLKEYDDKYGVEDVDYRVIPSLL